ncbi:MAG: Fe-S-containing hydro-lyase [Anaerorhabdus sp.]
MRNLVAPFTKEKIKNLKYNEQITITGTIYTARDAAHKRMIEMISRNEPLPFDVKDQIIYYVGPTPAKKGEIIGSAGPTTSSRMDDYTLILYDMGLLMTIGKGYRSEKVVDNIKKNQSCYAVAIGGLGALLSKCIIKSEIIAFEDLGSEAIRKLEVKDFPVTIAIDANGNNVYD